MSDQLQPPDALTTVGGPRSRSASLVWKINILSPQQSALQYESNPHTSRNIQASEEEEGCAVWTGLSQILARRRKKEGTVVNCRTEPWAGKECWKNTLSIQWHGVINTSVKWKMSDIVMSSRGLDMSQRNSLAACFVIRLNKSQHIVVIYLSVLRNKQQGY
jgi:hypothetical protein